MSLLAKLDHHAALMHRMADTVGADLGQALLAGRLTGEDLRAGVLNCCACDGAERCPGWMDGHPQGADTAPDYCRNRARLDAIKG